jgi:hypothetical protein
VFIERSQILSDASSGPAEIPSNRLYQGSKLIGFRSAETEINKIEDFDIEHRLL